MSYKLFIKRSDMFKLDLKDYLRFIEMERKIEYFILIFSFRLLETIEGYIRRKIERIKGLPESSRRRQR